MTTFLSASLMVDGGTIHCAACRAALASAAANWKDGAAMRETPLADVGAPPFVTGSSGVVLRHFYCPACATLLDTETARPGDPPLVDRVRPSTGR